MATLSASNLGLAYGEVEIFSGINLEVGDNAHVGIVGPNGSGKSSLLKVIVGELEPDAGVVTPARGLRIGYVPQSPGPSNGGTLRDEIMTAFDELRRLERSLEASALTLRQAGAGERSRLEADYSSLADRYEALGGYSYLSDLEQVAAGVGLAPESLAAPAISASGGQRTRAALARALLANPDLLILDEPTNYLDLKGLLWLEKLLGRYPRAFILVSHDRYFLDQVVSQVWELDHGSLRTFPGNYSKYRVLKAEQTQRQQRQRQRQQEFIEKEEAFIRRYRAGQRAREAKGRARRLDRLERIDAPERDSSVNIARVSASRTGLVVARTRNLKVGFFDEAGEATELLSAPDVRLERGSRTAIIGSNGAGKTTLLRTIMGLIPPVAGEVFLADNVKVGYFRQESGVWPEDSTVIDALLDVRNLPLGEARSYLARFLFRGDDVFQSVSSLSGGEQSRLSLSLLLITEPNLLVLDEPTTHLDIATREALEQVLLAYDGTVLLVSHDRHLVSLMARQMWIVEDGSLLPFDGTFEEWVRQEQEPALPPARTVRTVKPRPARNPVARPKKPNVVRLDNLEQVISELEDRLAEIERQLQLASETQDLAAIARLGVEHGETRLLLDQKWAEWAG